MSPLHKKPRLSTEPDEIVSARVQPHLPRSSTDADTDDTSANGSHSDSQDASASPDTEDELKQAVHSSKSKQSQKRKRRATSPSRFGDALQSLLTTDAPSNLPLSLKPSLGRKRHDQHLEVKAKKAVELVRKELEDTARVRDVIGGWGGESERGLRKVAQRGVVKLFNAIQQTQNAASQDAEDLKVKRGQGKPSLPAPKLTDQARRRSELKPDKAAFLDAIRSGGIVSKT